MKNIDLNDVHENTRKSYNLISEKYHELFQNELDDKPYDRQILTNFAGLFTEKAKILDAGCGPSFHIGNFLVNLDLEVVGVDISDRCIQMAQNLYPSIDFYRMNLIDLKFENETFDGIIAYYSIIDTPKKSIPAIFQEFYRILRPNGKLLVVVKEGKAEEYLEEVFEIPTHLYFSQFQVEELHELFKKGGFDIEFSETRKPNPSEIKISRIYVLGGKK
ncbi:2-methoxy-6-polyprenyl-1,4-benzoquinol methylase, mitochondrial [Candidatus Lokiarchaeum ossiferum]|uniref:2-methoxy-6-polyprenyl-1,4-benzoquinol methylase, mitochondrial n=1 Tax=Candidatus Lokiarchaeum ossiferum TaxID=2951803 RepID=A0ABY6I0H8_9ARCH|nr:2-methoxy-6-polyprenyl-1,4-benzoquinol methylase, mitochondrial [Candidatus Lokiarchaeum sp. B-35]